MPAAARVAGLLLTALAANAVRLFNESHAALEADLANRDLGALPWLPTGSDGTCKKASQLTCTTYPPASSPGRSSSWRNSRGTSTKCLALLRSLDEDFLPDVDLSSGTLTFTVVVGRCLANYEASRDREEGQ